MAASDWMRFQLAYGFGTVRAAKALEKWHSPTLLFHTEDWRLRQHGMGEEELRRHYFGSLDTGRMVANRAFEAPFDPPMYGFRSDPYDNQSGECEVDGVGLYGDALDTRKELVDFEDL